MMEQEYLTIFKFNDLNDDCLFYIFKHLNLQQKFAVLRVCKKWRNKMYEVLNCQEELVLCQPPNKNEQLNVDFSNSLFIFRRNLSSYEKLSHIFKNIPNIRNLIFAGIAVSCELLKFCLQHLSSIEEVNFVKAHALRDDMEMMEPLHDVNMQSLRKICFKFCRGTFSSLLRIFAEKSSELVQFEYSTYYGMVDDTQNMLPSLITIVKKSASSLKQLNLSVLKCSSLNTLLLEARNLKGLKVALADEPKIEFEIFLQDYILSSHPLKVLELKFWRPMNLSSSFKYKTSFQSLLDLKLSNFMLNQHSLKTLLQNTPNLEKLNMRYQACCTESVCLSCESSLLSSVALLKKLRSLALYSDDVNGDESIIRIIRDGQLPNLRKLECSDYSIRDLLIAFCQFAERNPSKIFIRKDVLYNEILIPGWTMPKNVITQRLEL